MRSNHLNKDRYGLKKMQAFNCTQQVIYRCVCTVGMVAFAIFETVPIFIQMITTVISQLIPLSHTNIARIIGLLEVSRNLFC